MPKYREILSEMLYIIKCHEADKPLYVEFLHNDGWGEGFEQRPRKIESGELYVHFWQPDQDYRAQTEQELKGLPELQRKPKNKVRNNHQHER